MKHEPISGSTATRFELAPVHSGSDTIRRHAEEGRYVLDRVNLAVAEGASHQRVFSPWAKRFVRALRAVRADSRTSNGDPGIRGDQSPSLRGRCSSQRAHLSISVIGFAPQKVALDRDLFSHPVVQKGIGPSVTFSASE
jgi:hypothetical protein